MQMRAHRMDTLEKSFLGDRKEVERGEKSYSVIEGR